MIWYGNAQGPVSTEGTPSIEVPASGNYIFNYLDVPHSGDRAIMLSSDFCVCVENSGRDVLDVWAQIGVSSPSETEYPMRPLVGVLHSNARARILPGSMVMLHVIRLDVIDLKLLPTNIPWTMASTDGKFPRLAPQVFAPAGTKLCNCAARAVLIE